MKVQKIAILTIEDIIYEYSLCLEKDVVDCIDCLESILDWTLRIRSDEELVTCFIHDKLVEDVVKKNKCSMVAVQMKDKLVIIYPSNEYVEPQKNNTDEK